MSGSLTGTPSFLNPATVVGAQSQEERLDISRDEFFQLLITELRTQDPLEPMDNQEMLGQLAQLEMLNSQTQMTNGINELTGSLKLARLNESASMLGKVVEGSLRTQLLDEDNLPVMDVNGNPVYDDVPVEGLVASVATADNGDMQLNLLVPVIGNDGLPVVDQQGNMITREESILISSVSRIRDPLIGAEAISSDEVSGN